MSNEKYELGRCTAIDPNGRRCTVMRVSEAGLCSEHEASDSKDDGSTDSTPDSSNPSAAGDLSGERERAWLDLDRCLARLWPSLETEYAGQAVRFEVHVNRHWETHKLTVGVYGDPPKLLFNQWLELTADGTLLEPAADDGFTSIGAPTKTLGHYSSDAEALVAINAGSSTR